MGNDAGISAGSDAEYDDVHERNYRQAKELLAKLEVGTSKELTR